MPTPTVCGNYNRKGLTAKSGDGLATAVYRLEQLEREQFPTPTKRDWRSGKTKQTYGNSRPLSEAVATPQCGTLNPAWVEWLMGFPIGWTELEA